MNDSAGQKWRKSWIYWISTTETPSDINKSRLPHLLAENN
uniref:Uncharacterized protein n=1 Tax=Moniliophthora roreri TaxID=221103 RepID=A0A0W0FA84_MONRR